MFSARSRHLHNINHVAPSTLTTLYFPLPRTCPRTHGCASPSVLRLSRHRARFQNGYNLSSPPHGRGGRRRGFRGRRARKAYQLPSLTSSGEENNVPPPSSVEHPTQGVPWVDYATTSHERRCPLNAEVTCRIRLSFWRGWYAPLTRRPCACNDVLTIKRSSGPFDWPLSTREIEGKRWPPRVTVVHGSNRMKAGRGLTETLFDRVGLEIPPLAPNVPRAVKRGVGGAEPRSQFSAAAPAPRNTPAQAQTPSAALLANTYNLWPADPSNQNTVAEATVSSHDRATQV